MSSQTADSTIKPDILITGAAGFIGRHLTHETLRRGHNVRLHDMRSPAEEDLQVYRVKFKNRFEVLSGDLTDTDEHRKLTEGIRTIIHTAALVKEGGSISEFRKVNVRAPFNLARAAKEAGVRTFIHLSSVMVYGFRFVNGITEAGPFRGEGAPYCQTKIESEKELMRLNSDNFRVIIIRPGDVYGPGSVPWVIRPLRLMKKGLFPLVDGGGGRFNHLHISNLIDGIFLALEKAPGGEAFNLTDGARTTVKEYFNMLADATELNRPLPVPYALAKAAAFSVQTVGSLTGIDTGLNADALDYFLRDQTYSISKAARLLGYLPVIELEEGMRDIKWWLKDNPHILEG